VTPVAAERAVGLMVRVVCLVSVQRHALLRPLETPQVPGTAGDA
jgi:hypothetical protein